MENFKESNLTLVSHHIRLGGTLIFFPGLQDQHSKETKSNKSHISKYKYLGIFSTMTKKSGHLPYNTCLTEASTNA